MNVEGIKSDVRKLIGVIVLLALGVSGCLPQQKSSSQEAAVEQETAAAVDPGKAVYDQNCLICHQRNGTGVPGLQPSLVDSDWAQGDPKRLVRLVLVGSTGFDEVSGDEYGNVMPGFAQLSDAELVAVLSYIRHSFGNDADVVSDSLIADMRGRL